MAALSAAGLYGKIPAQADFVRIQAADPLARALVLWLEEGSERAKRAGVATSSEPVRFLFRPAGAPQALVGVIAGSTDKVGRSFPLALFARIESPDLATVFPALPGAAAPFLAAAETVARDAARLTAAELAARVGGLPVPAAADLGGRDAEARALAAAERGDAFLARLFGDLASGQHLYALHCVRSACRAVRGEEPARAAAVLDCPVRAEVDRWVWLELVRRGLDWQAPPSFFWRGGLPSRLLVSLGPAPHSLFGALFRDAAGDPAIWPLVTGRPGAIVEAQRALGASVIDALGREDLPLAALVDRVMR